MREDHHWEPKTWTNHEVMALFQHRASGLTMRQIATQMERSYDSIRAKYKATAVQKQRKPTRKPIVETISITKADVPKFYELGWRFVGFSDVRFSVNRLCVMEKTS
jgi:hypothetical protein